METQPSPIPPRVAWRDAPGVYADRLGVTPSSLLVGLAVVVAAAMGAWWALKPPAAAVTESTLPRVETLEIASATTTVPTPQPVVVHVDGAVAAPGVHEVRPGSRVVDAIAAAGGLTADADRSRLNLALVVVDEQRIWVPRMGEQEPAVILPTGGISSPGSASTAGGLVNINQATAGELESLPGIGPSLATAIIEHRERQGPFSTVAGLIDVAGIGPAKLARLESEATI